MWNAIKSDLSEFVTSVAEETDQVAKAVIKDGDGNQVASNNIDDDDDVVNQSEEEEPIVVDDEAVLRMMIETKETLSTPLDESNESVQKFLDSFDIDKKTEEISTILEENPETVKHHFETLVPTELSYEIFWQRYFYRCGSDADAVERRRKIVLTNNKKKDDEPTTRNAFKDRMDEMMEATNKASRAEAIQGGIKQVKNLFGGAINVVSQTLEKADVEAQRERAMNLFGGPQNTAIDSEDDDAGGEEEALGWDDDDSAEDNNEKINRIAANLREQLGTAIDERDSLKETVELQRTELIKLRVTTLTVEEREEIEKMKIDLAEKNAELEAIKATSNSEGGGNAEMIEKAKQDAAQITTLRLDIEKLNTQLSIKDAELTTAKERVKAGEEEAVKEKEAASKRLRSSLEEAEAKTDSMKNQLEETKKREEDTKLELEAVKKRVHELEQAAAQTATQPNSSSSSESTGVKVEAAVATVGNPTDANNDAWGDEDW